MSLNSCLEPLPYSDTMFFITTQNSLAKNVRSLLLKKFKATVQVENHPLTEINQYLKYWLVEITTTSLYKCKVGLSSFKSNQILLKLSVLRTRCIMNTSGPAVRYHSKHLKPYFHPLQLCRLVP